MQFNISNFLKAAFIFLLSWSTVHASNTGNQSSNHSKEEAVVRAVNAYRSQHGLKPLKMVSLISTEARGHSQAMSNKSVPFGHQNFMKRFKHITSSMKQNHGGSENVAWFPPSKGSDEVVKMWLTSRGHRHNIEGPFDLTGVGIVRDQRGWYYYTQIFIRT